MRERPRVVFAQNPSLALALFLACCKPLLGFRLVIDAHNAGIRPAEGRSSLLNLLARAAIRRADLNLVTNDALLEVVRDAGGRGYVLPDPIPLFQNTLARKKQLEGESNILFICTFADDEPYGEVIRAAELLGQGNLVYITGDYLKVKMHFDDLPPNVRFTGFVSDADYVSLLLSSDVVLDLTTRENCLVCGAYEAVACERPLVVSDTDALRTYFYKGTVYTRNDRRAIAGALRQALDSREVLTEQMSELKRELEKQWSKRERTLKELLESW